jgi:gamma-glutamyltranspeptidase/glutathione hydrolase
MDIQAAVSAARFHHQWLPDVIVFEPNQFEESLFNALQQKQYQIKEEYSRIIGRVDAIHLSELGEISTGADPRGDDKAVHLY